MFGRVLRETWKTIMEIWASPGQRGFILSVAGVFAVGTVFYRAVEGWSWLDSLYFTVVTVTTVGYGDLTPTTGLSRVFTIVLILLGVSYILAFLNFLVRRTVERKAHLD